MSQFSNGHARAVRPEHAEDGPFYADFAPAQAAAIRRAIDLMKEATS